MKKRLRAPKKCLSGGLAELVEGVRRCHHKRTAALLELLLEPSPLIL
eukprot:CAMPEP_0171596560 /NCGR_PEP_ID=MMETSP0990-20121206/2008_1 /TAXON_ID=483369 /ORGANISM="non described non described, Strain CCMP2098" /LENGTH=46 /DNA_ID= /DNA_START= /DNA_END= /DNA_ORIENTATION=